MSERPILVTGSHRSGSTWVGRMMAKAPKIAYIHEPFHIHHRKGICGAEFKYWFTYISAENESFYYKDIEKTIKFEYNLSAALKAKKLQKDLWYTLRDYFKFMVFRSFNFRPLIKDPIALFSAEWLASAFDMDVIVLIRHPAAFAGSLKRLNWRHPFSDFLAQPLIMKDHLYPFENELKMFSDKKYDIIDQAILLWKMICHVIIKYKTKHSGWIFLRHEDISQNPSKSFESLFKKLNIHFSGKVRRAIIEHTHNFNPSEAPAGGDSLKRNSKSNIYNWKNRLTKSEIERIRESINDVSGVFYSDKDW
jgi:hypothetical protein